MLFDVLVAIAIIIAQLPHSDFRGNTRRYLPLPTKMNLASFQNLCHWHLFQPCTVQMKQISMLENQGKMLLEVPENNNEKKEV